MLCNLIGRDVENSEIPDDDSLLGPMIRNICYANAQQYLQLPMDKSNRENRTVRRVSGTRLHNATRRGNEAQLALSTLGPARNTVAKLFW